MKKLLLSLAMLLTGVVAWAQENWIIGLTSTIPTTVTAPADITTGYYLLKEVNPNASGKPGGFLKAASEANDAAVTPQGNAVLTVENTDNTYIWYIEKNEENSTYTIATANKAAAWQAPSRGEKRLVSYASKVALTFTTEAVTLDNKTASPIENSFIVQNVNKTACVHYSGNNLGSWDDANPASVMMFQVYKVDPTDFKTEDIAIHNIRTYLAANESGNETIVGSYTTAAHSNIQSTLNEYDKNPNTQTKTAAIEAFNSGQRVTLSSGEKFTLKCIEDARGYLVYSTVNSKGSETEPWVASTNWPGSHPGIDETGVYKDWAFVTVDGKNYLFNVEKQMFVRRTNSEPMDFAYSGTAFELISNIDGISNIKMGNSYLASAASWQGNHPVRATSLDNGAKFYIEKADESISNNLRTQMENKIKNMLGLGTIDEWKAAQLSVLGYVGGYTQDTQSAIEDITDYAGIESFIQTHSTKSMAPGYYYIKGTGNGNEATWYATYDGNKTKFQATNFDETDKIKFVWKFEDVENGYKMLSCNLNKYATLENASNNNSSASTLAENKGYGHKFVPTNDGLAKFALYNGDNWIMRTENGGAINYWSGEGNERWYLIPVPAEDLAMEVTIGAAGYSSAYLPIDVTLPDGLKAYIVEETTTNSAKLTPINDIAGHQGVILNGTAGQSYTLNVGTATSDFSNNKLKGSIFDTYVPGEAYVLATKDGNAGFYNAMLNKDENGNGGTTHFKNNARKAYLPVSADGARFLLFDFGTETGIEDINSTETGITGTAAIYDLSGRRVQKAQKGIYIVNGKKVIK